MFDHSNQNSVSAGFLRARFYVQTENHLIHDNVRVVKCINSRYAITHIYINLLNVTTNNIATTYYRKMQIRQRVSRIMFPIYRLEEVTLYHVTLFRKWHCIARNCTSKSENIRYFYRMPILFSSQKRIGESTCYWYEKWVC